jgi:hypothetical protein
MNRITRLIGRARRIRQGGKGPLVENADEARDIAREIAVALRGLKEEDRVLFYSNLADLGHALSGRLSALKDERSKTRGELVRLDRSLSATRAYAAPRGRSRRGAGG